MAQRTARKFSIHKVKILMVEREIEVIILHKGARIERTLFEIEFFRNEYIFGSIANL